MDSYEIFTVALDRPNQTIPYHTTPYQTKPHQTKPTVQPLSKLVQDSIQHLIPKLKHKARDTKHIHQIITQLICDYCGTYYKVNSGTSMGPCHSCDYADIFVGVLDDKFVQKLEDENIDHTAWKIFRDDGWDILLNADEDLRKFLEALDPLHPNIKWYVKASSAENNHALEYLDLTIYIIDGKIETDLFAKDIPIFLSRKSCHPDHVFKSVVKSAGIRLNMNCSTDKFLWDRKNEYSRYFFASFYKPKEVNSIMDEVTGLTKNNHGDFVRGPARENCEDLIFLIGIIHM